MMSLHHDAVIIGGGFYGVAIAAFLVQQRGFKQVALIEREAGLLTRASYNNQARVHNGYHYPRSFTTAYRSRINFPKFVQDWPQVIKQDFTKLYAISRRNSKVTSKQFERFCRDIGVEFSTADPMQYGLFEPRLIENVYVVKEFVFDTVELTKWATQELVQSGVSVRYGTHATAISTIQGGGLRVTIRTGAGVEEQISSRYVFNCTYSGLNQFFGDFSGIRSGLKQEITEMALMKMPESLCGFGVTVMDGPFFSLMPFPARGLHTLSHVRYTPHQHWNDERGLDPYEKLRNYHKISRVDRMVRDVARYMPEVMKASYQGSLFEVKTVLTKSESDDGRPILFEKHMALPGCYSILGGKIDNIYDVLERLGEVV